MAFRTLVIVTALAGMCGLTATAEAHKINPEIIEKLTGEKMSYDHPETTAGDPRGWSRTFYSFPEWYIVYSAQEYGDFVIHGGRPSDFPFFAAIGQLWESWRLAEAAAGEAPDSTTETILLTITLSTSFEYGVIGLYEKTSGRFFEFLNHFNKTPEDRFTDTAAFNYGQFLEHTPWFAFPYSRMLTQLWSLPYPEQLNIRSLERRFVFTIGYGLKAIYGGVIHYLSDSKFGGAELSTTATIITDTPDALNLPEVTNITHLGDQRYTVSLPRYKALVPVVIALAERKVAFQDIQGHQTIALSVVAKTNDQCLDRTHVVFEQPILTRPKETRFMLHVSVDELSDVVNALKTCSIVVEHIYDY